MEVRITIEKSKCKELIQYLNSESICDQKYKDNIILFNFVNLKDIYDNTKETFIFTEPNSFHKCFKYLLSEKLEYMTVIIFKFDQSLFQNISFEEIDYIYKNCNFQSYDTEIGLLHNNDKFVWNLFIQNSAPIQGLPDILRIFRSVNINNDYYYDQFYSLLNLINKGFKHINVMNLDGFLTGALIDNNNLLMLNLWCVFLRKYQLKILYLENYLFSSVIYTIFCNKLDYTRILVKLHQSLKGTFDHTDNGYMGYFTTPDGKIITNLNSIEYLCRKMKDKTIVMPDDFIQAYSSVLNKHHNEERAREILRILRQNFPDESLLK